MLRNVSDRKSLTAQFLLSPLPISAISMCIYPCPFAHCPVRGRNESPPENLDEPGFFGRTD